MSSANLTEAVSRADVTDSFSLASESDPDEYDVSEAEEGQAEPNQMWRVAEELKKVEEGAEPDG